MLTIGHVALASATIAAQQANLNLGLSPEFFDDALTSVPWVTDASAPDTPTDQTPVFALDPVGNWLPLSWFHDTIIHIPYGKSTRAGNRGLTVTV